MLGREDRCLSKASQCLWPLLGIGGCALPGRELWGCPRLLPAWGAAPAGSSTLGSSIPGFSNPWLQHPWFQHPWLQHPWLQHSWLQHVWLQCLYSSTPGSSTCSKHPARSGLTAEPSSPASWSLGELMIQRFWGKVYHTAQQRARKPPWDLFYTQIPFSHLLVTLNHIACE